MPEPIPQSAQVQGHGQQDGVAVAYPTPQNSLDGSSPPPNVAPTPIANTYTAQPQDDDHNDDDDNDNVHDDEIDAFAARQRAFSLIMPDDLSRYRSDALPDIELRYPSDDERSSVEDDSWGLYPHDEDDRDSFHMEDEDVVVWEKKSDDEGVTDATPVIPSPPAEVSTPMPSVQSNPLAHQTSGNDNANGAEGYQDHFDSMPTNSPPKKSSCPFTYLNPPGVNYMACPFLRGVVSQGRSQDKLPKSVSSKDYRLAFKAFTNSIAHHGDVLPMLAPNTFDAMRLLDSVRHPTSFHGAFKIPFDVSLFDVEGALPSTTWEDGREHLDASVSTLFVTTAGMPARDPAPARPTRPLLPKMQEYYDLHDPCHRSNYYLDPDLILDNFHPTISCALLATLLCPSQDTEFNKANGRPFPANERNLTVSEFVRQWLARSILEDEDLDLGEDFFTPISSEAAHIHDWLRPKKISRPKNRSITDFDIQGIPWSSKLKVRRLEARQIRDATYKSYHNIAGQDPGYPCGMPNIGNHYIPKAMYTEYKATMEHFQLRNLMSVTASNTIQYVRDSKVYSVTPFYGEENCLLNLSDIDESRPFMDYVKITTMKAKHGVTMVGGFDGEYAYRADTTTDTVAAEGYIPREMSGIVTHVDLVMNRTSSNPQAVIATNDAVVHILDCQTHTFLDQHHFANPINCSETSPDGNLRVIVGDSRYAWITDAASGKPVRELVGHEDFGFACAWSPDSMHVATANQDRTVNIWDVRMWKRLQTVDSDISCYRSLRYSPLGGGPRSLLMCEPADRVVVLDAQHYQTRQVHDFFGEIGGADFTPDGGRFWVANMDPEFGGLIEYERRDLDEAYARRARHAMRSDFLYLDDDDN